MNESELFVDNPLALGGLFGQGVFLAGEKKQATEGIPAAGTEILVLLHYPELPKLPPKALQVLQKIMEAVKISGKPLVEEDYAVVNSGRLDQPIIDFVANTGAKKVILWADSWPLETREIVFYQKGMLENVEMLRCHSLHTVMADAERKKACWTAIRAFFGM